MKSIFLHHLLKAKKKLQVNYPVILSLASIICSPANYLASQVRVYQEPLTLPTYGIMEPEMMPNWEADRYPYTMFDRLSNEKHNKTYNALWIENEYVKALVLPEIGGRLHGAMDKTNGYQFLYNQKVIKPGLISLTGAWISGGIEWNFPNGHRPSGFRDTDWKLVENPDSSKTIWVGEFDRITGMRWSVGTTVHPGRNWIETKVRLYNCTPFIHRFQYWATSAVRATYDYQAVIPGEVMTGHGKHEFYHWPVNNGTDISYWKNTPAATSYFAVESESDYFGGYSPEEHAGMVHVADHFIVRGKKLWTWGTAPAGRLWEKILTDGDLPYFEPQAGAYSDNQPSLFWIMPGETKIFSHYWYPVRDIGVYDYANLEGSLNLDLKDRKASFGWSPTGMNKDAVVIVTCNGKEIFHQKVNADPATPFLGKAVAPADADLYQLKMTVLSSAGDTLLAFRHQWPTNSPLPEPAPPPLPPEQVKSQDLLFLTGDRFNRYNDPQRAKSYYLEALKRDPGDVRSNTALGELALKEGLFAKALEYFNTSINRDETHYEAWYFKGLTQMWLGDTKGAEKSLNRSGYSQSWYAIAHFELAQLCASQNRLNDAMEHIERSIRGNGDNTQAYAVKSLILTRSGFCEEALKIAHENLVVDPLDFFSQALEIITLKKMGKDVSIAQKKLFNLTRRDNENHIQLALRFARCGSYNDAADMLGLLTSMQRDSGISPLVYFFQGYYEHLAGDEEKASKLRKIASEISSKYCFPNQLEAFPVLGWALSVNPDDAQAQYLLGNLLYSRFRSDEAVSHWAKSVALNPLNAVAYRNLGLVYHEQGDLQKAKEAYQAALRADPSAGRVLVELGYLNNEMKIPYADQIDLFEKNMKVVSTYNQALMQLIELYILTGRYNDALKWLTASHFNSWEGQYGIHQYWVQSNIKQGDIEYEHGQYQKAFEYYTHSLAYPDNLEVAEQPNTVHAREYYKIGKALEALGEKKQASQYFRWVIADTVVVDNAYQYYRGKAFESLDKKTTATEIYTQMLAASDKAKIKQQHDQGESAGEETIRERNARAVKLFCRSLALEGLGKTEEAESQRKAALQLYPLVELSAFKSPRSGF